jgi:hypothetical protein
MQTNQTMNPSTQEAVLTALAEHRGSTVQQLRDHLQEIYPKAITHEEILKALTFAMYQGLTSVTHGSNAWECTKKYLDLSKEEAVL